MPEGISSKSSLSSLSTLYRVSENEPGSDKVDEYCTVSYVGLRYGKFSRDDDSLLQRELLISRWLDKPIYVKERNITA